MAINCEKCKKFSFEPYINEQGDVVCSECDEIIPNVSPFIKSTLKGRKTKIQREVLETLSTKCRYCGLNGQPTIDEADKTHCKFCKRELQMTQTFKDMLKKKLAELAARNK